MRINLRAFGILATMSCLGFSVAFAADGSWKFQTEDRGHPELSYSGNDKTIFMVGCGHAFAIHAVYTAYFRTRKSEGLITRKLSVTESRRASQFRGTSRVRKVIVFVLKSRNVA